MLGRLRCLLFRETHVAKRSINPKTFVFRVWGLEEGSMTLGLLYWGSFHLEVSFRGIKSLIYISSRISFLS